MRIIYLKRALLDPKWAKGERLVVFISSYYYLSSFHVYKASTPHLFGN